MSEYTGPDQQSYAPLTTTKGATPSALNMSQVASSANPNYEGTPTEYYDKSGNLIGYLGYNNNVMSTSGLNFVNPDGTPNTGAINKHSLFQATDENGNLLFQPAAATQAGEAPSYVTQDQGAGPVLQMLSGQMKMNAPSPSLLQDPLFRNFVISAATMGAGAALAPAAGAMGGTEAFPVALSDSITMSPLSGSVAGLGAGSLTEGLTPAMIAAQEAALPATMADIGGLSAAGTGGLTAAQALQYAKMGLSGLGLANQMAGGAGGSQGGSGGGAGGSQGGSGGGSGGSTTNVSYNSSGPWNAPLSPHLATVGQTSQRPITSGLEHLTMLEPSLDPAFGKAEPETSIKPQSYFAYGSQPQTNYPMSEPIALKNGGGVLQSYKNGGKPHVPEFITGTTGHYVKGRGDGQSDDIPAMLADGEYVFDADTVAQLGNGSSDAGAKVLDKMREALRAHKRSAPVHKIPPKAKSPLEYIKQGMKRK